MMLCSMSWRRSERAKISEHIVENKRAKMPAKHLEAEVQEMSCCREMRESFFCGSFYVWPGSKRILAIRFAVAS